MKKIAMLTVSMLICAAAANAAANAVSVLRGSAGDKAVSAVAVPAVSKAVNVEKADPGVTAGAWKRANLKAADGTFITVDYTPITAPNYVLANPVWVNVYVNDSAQHRIRVILSNFLYVTAGPSPVKDTQQVDLWPAGNGRYTGQFQRVLLSEGVYSYGGNIYRQELAIVKDGNWLKDPVNGSHNFRFQMSN